MKVKFIGITGVIVLTMLFSGCVHHRMDSLVRPSAVPQKIMTMTAIPEEPKTPVVVDPDADPWTRCEILFTDSEISMQRVADLEPEDYLRRVQITFMIQDGEKDTSYILQRCMNGKLFVCRVSGSTNCLGKLDFTIEPNDAMKEFCEDPENNNLVISSAISGLNSAFEWRCLEGTPAVVAQIAEADAEGYDRSIWLSIPKP